MKESQSITNNLLMEVYVLSNRLRNIKQSFKTTHNKALKERLFSENKTIFRRVKEISQIADLLNKKNNGKLNFSNLLVEITQRTLNENKFESNLFFLYPLILFEHLQLDLKIRLFLYLKFFLKSNKVAVRMKSNQPPY